MSKPEIMRCVKRYLAREVYHALVADFEALTELDDLYEHPGFRTYERLGNRSSCALRPHE